uniref:Uncharacterized protein n=1 Tax=Zea mays TaxID=4577 RepID=C0PF16_MAIZE|nr:unknown [Zea mays]
MSGPCAHDSSCSFWGLVQSRQPRHSYTGKCVRSQHAAHQKHRPYRFPLDRVQGAEFLDEGSICNCECMLCHNLHRGRHMADQHSLWLLESEALGRHAVFLLVALAHAALQ